MASPPYRSPAASPPHPAHSVLPNPRKRPLGTGPVPGASNYNKRRKPSSFSTGSFSHPLRQTSFPPEESSSAQLQRSPSVDSDYTTITGAPSVAASATGGKKRGRKKKGETASVKSGGGTKEAAGDTASKTGAPDDDADGDDEEGDVGDDDVVDEGGKIDLAAEKKKLGVLMDAFNPDQNERYNSFRRVKLKKETVRKIVNQTLSQSVPPSVITTINGFTKVFIGTLVERAREIQRQSDRAARTLPTPSPSTEEDHASDPKPNANGIVVVDGGGGGGIEGLHSAPNNRPDLNPNPNLDLGPLPLPSDGYLGPLLPDHLREAHRRYRRNGEGGGSGVSGLSVGLGFPGAGVARMRDKRLFR